MLRNDLVDYATIFAKYDDKFASNNKDFLKAIVIVWFSMYG